MALSNQFKRYVSEARACNRNALRARRHGLHTLAAQWFRTARVYIITARQVRDKMERAS